MTTLEIIENIVFYLALYVLLWNAYFLTVNKGIPNIRTAPAIRKKIIELIKEDIAKKKKEEYLIIDMGSGNGDFSRQIAREVPEARVVGIEISKLAYWKSCIAKKWCGLKNLEYWNMNFKDADISKADAVTMFLLGTLMTSIRATLEKGLAKDTLVTSNKFPIGGDWEPEQTIDVETLYPHQKRLFVYHSK